METNRNKAQFFFQLGGCAFHLTPVTILKCGLVAKEYVCGTNEDLHEYRRLANNLWPYLMSMANDMDPILFSQAVQKRIASIIEMEKLTSPLACGYARNIQRRLGNRLTLHKAIADASKFGRILTEWLEGTNGILIGRAIEIIQSYGVTPLLPLLGTVANLGSHICGRYQPALHTVATQLDVLAGKSNPPLYFLDVLLHEQVHASIYQNLAYDPGRRELEWLHELAAITTSHQAIIEAARSLGYDTEIRESCCILRKEQRYGDFAQNLLDHVSDPLIAWKTWQDIFMLPDSTKHQYARREIIEPILWERGWSDGLHSRHTNKRASQT